MKKFNKLTYIYIIGIIGLMGFGFGQNNQTCINGSGNCSRQMQVGVRLYNSYSGNIDYYNSNIGQFATGGNIYVSNIYNQVAINATDTSIYTISGDISTGSLGGGSGNYSNTQGIYLTNGDGEKYIQSNFLKIAEFYDSNIIKFVLDQTPPTKPSIIGPSMGSLQTSLVNFERTASIDTGVGFSGYYLYFSLNPNGPYTKVWAGSQSGYSIDGNLLPSGTIYRYVSAIDNLGNTSDPVYGFFHNKAPTILNGNIFNNNTADQNNIYPQNQEKEHFIASIDDTQKKECNIHGYDDFSDCKAVLENKYILKNKIYEAYFAIKGLDEDEWLLPIALPNSGVEGYMSGIDNKEYMRLLPNEEIDNNQVCLNQYLENNRLPRILVIILSLYIVYDKTREKKER